MVARLLFLFVAFPLIDLVLLLLLAEATNWIFTVLLILATGLLGVCLAKNQGLAAIRRIRADVGQGRMPAAAVLDAALILLAAALLLAPGVLTDILGISLLVPTLRRRYRQGLVEWLQSRSRSQSTGQRESSGRRSEVIDSYVIEGTRETTRKDSQTPYPSSGA